MIKCLPSDERRGCCFVPSLCYHCHCSFPVLPGDGDISDSPTACTSERQVILLVCYQLRKYPVIIRIHIYSKPTNSEFTSQGFNCHNLCWILNSKRDAKHSLKNCLCQTFISSAILFMHRWMPLSFMFFSLVFIFDSFCKVFHNLFPQKLLITMFCFNLHHSIFITVFHTFASSSLIL